MNSVTGKIKTISALQTMRSRAGREFTKQSVFLDAGEYDRNTGDYYPNDLLLDFINNRGGDISGQFRAGDRVTISFRLHGRSWDSRSEPGKKEYGVSVSCFRIEPAAKTGGHDTPPQELVQAVAQSPAFQQEQPQAFAAPSDNDDRLPF